MSDVINRSETEFTACSPGGNEGAMSKARVEGTMKHEQPNRETKNISRRKQ